MAWEQIRRKQAKQAKRAILSSHIFVDGDIAIALGNPSLGYSPLQAIKFVLQYSLVSRCPEAGNLAFHTRCRRILTNTVVEPKR